MQGHSIDAPSSRRSHDGERRAGDWRTGEGRATRWDETVLAVCFLSLGAGVLLAASASALIPQVPELATWALWLGMGFPVVYALVRARPSLLLRFRPLDLVYGLALGILLRTVQGRLAVAAGGDGAFPSYPAVDGRLGGAWVFEGLLGPLVIAPVVEELFFRGVLLVSVYMLVRRIAGRGAAAFSSIAVSVGAFVLVHSWAGAVEWDAAASLALLALVCGVLVILTGRVWSAVAVHVVYSATYVALALVGTYLV